MKLETYDLKYIGSNRLHYDREKLMSMEWNYLDMTNRHKALYAHMSSKWQVDIWVDLRVGSPWYLYRKVK